MKICYSCQEEKPNDSFYANKRYKGGFTSQCKECHKQYYRAYCADPQYKHARKTSSRKSHLKRHYDMDTASFNEMLLKQGEACLVCDEKLDVEGGNAAVDHNHNTGEVRGILCKKCNSILGFANDNPKILIKAVAYLTEHGHYG